MSKYCVLVSSQSHFLRRVDATIFSYRDDTWYFLRHFQWPCLNGSIPVTASNKQGNRQHRKERENKYQVSRPYASYNLTFVHMIMCLLFIFFATTASAWLSPTTTPNHLWSSPTVRLIFSMSSASTPSSSSSTQNYNVLTEVIIPPPIRSTEIGTWAHDTMSRRMYAEVMQVPWTKKMFFGVNATITCYNYLN